MADESYNYTVEQPEENDGFEGRTPTKGRSFKRRLIFLIVVVVVIIGIVLAWTFFNPDARRAREMNENYERVQKWIEDAEQLKAADNYGGKTPQETLDLFVAALRNGDMELASKYFVADIRALETEHPILSKQKWLDDLMGAQQENRLGEIADIVERAVPDFENRAYENDFKFAVYKKGSQELEVYINLEFNEASGVWQIESL